MSPQTIPILLNLVAAVAGAFGQFFYKKGSQKIAQGFYLNSPLITGVLLFCVVMVLFVIAYRLGGKISVVYPFYATTFIWGTLIGVYLDNEPWRPLYAAGSVLLLMGLAVIAWASERGAL